MNENISWSGIIEGIVMAIIATMMCIIFARTKATGDNNLFWILVVAVINVVVILLTVFDLAATSWKQLSLSVPYAFLLLAQLFLIQEGKISEACCHYWWEFSIGVAICIFNCAVYEVDEDAGGEFLAGMITTFSIIPLGYAIATLLKVFYDFISSI
jgi:ABC-type phosphate/phosphonate transport system permease subunit